MSSVRREKLALRNRFRQIRSAFDEAERAARSRAIVSKLVEIPELCGLPTILSYWPFADEIDIRALIGQFYRQGVRIALPVVDFSSTRPAMHAAVYDGDDALHPNRWGIFEPVGTPHVYPSELGAVIVPALGAGQNGHRIGYGGGHYDALLAGLEVPTICTVHAECLVEYCPFEAHDVSVDVLVTEHDIVRVGSLPATQPR